jgi:hypothetical protein
VLLPLARPFPPSARLAILARSRRTNIAHRVRADVRVSYVSYTPLHYLARSSVFFAPVLVGFRVDDMSALLILLPNIFTY